MKFYFIAPRHLSFDIALELYYSSIGKTATEAWIKFDQKLLKFDEFKSFDSLRLQEWSNKGYGPREIEIKGIS